MNIQFDRQRLLEDQEDRKTFAVKVKNYLIQHAHASEEAASMLAKAVEDDHITFQKAVDIAKATTGMGEASMIGGGVGAAGATFTPGLGMQYTTKKKVEEDAPMLAHGKADISTYLKDKFTKVEGRANLKSIEPKDLWGTEPTAMSDLDEVITKATKEQLDKVINTIKEKSPKLYNYILDLIIDIQPQDDQVKTAMAQALAESRYSSFKRETATRTKTQQMHEAAKIINKKLEEINKLFEFASQMKNELSEGEMQFEYSHNTKSLFEKINTKVIELYSKIKKLK